MHTPTMAGYSKTPLFKKLGIKSGSRILLYKQPENYLELIKGLPEDVHFLKQSRSEVADFIHIFLSDQKDLHKVGAKYKTALKKDGMLWVSWPKQSSGVDTDLKDGVIRDFFLQAGLVDIKVAAIDDTFSGLKFVYRRQDR